MKVREVLRALGGARLAGAAPARQSPWLPSPDHPDRRIVIGNEGTDVPTGVSQRSYSVNPG